MKSNGNQWETWHPNSYQFGENRTEQSKYLYLQKSLYSWSVLNASLMCITFDSHCPEDFLKLMMNSLFRMDHDSLA